MFASTRYMCRCTRIAIFFSTAAHAGHAYRPLNMMQSGCDANPITIGVLYFRSCLFPYMSAQYIMRRIESALYCICASKHLLYLPVNHANMPAIYVSIKGEYRETAGYSPVPHQPKSQQVPSAFRARSYNLLQAPLR